MDKKELSENLRKEKIKFQDLEKYVSSEEATKIRQEYIIHEGINIDNITKTVLNSGETKPNIENMIGAIQIPLGIAGPVNINGFDKKTYLPLATTEGALVASVNRGCKVINLAGGADTLIVSNFQTRSLLFKAKSLSEVCKFEEWIKSNFIELKKIGEKDEKFIELLEIETYVFGINVWLRIKADTKDAMGMNMVTIAGKNIADYIIQNYDGNVEFLSESGNLCVDKKPSAMNFINGRGKKVVASVRIPNDVVKNVLKTTPKKMADLNYRKTILGSAVSGSLGYNAHFANMIAALFIATGQDVAHTVEGSLGITTVELFDKHILFTVTLPNLQLGTVGGGTGLRTQKEALKILGVYGPGNPPGSNSKKFAKIVAAAVLAGEISLLGALCSQDLSKAHKKLNR